MRRETRLMDVRRKLGCPHYYAWRVSCRLHGWQKRFVQGTAAGNLSEHVGDIISGLAWGMADICTYMAKNGLKTALRAIVGVYIVCSLLGACGASEGGTAVYPKVLVVDAVDYETHTVRYRDAYGFTWTVMQEDMDVSEGECYAVIMDDMGTRQIVDDTIVSMRYQRLDLLEGVER